MNAVEGQCEAISHWFNAANVCRELGYGEVSQSVQVEYLYVNEKTNNRRLTYSDA